MSKSAEEPGQLERLRTALAARYAIEHEVGRGGMATVYLARDLRHERRVAVKVLRPELASALGPDRFLREIKVTAGLDHPHILPLLDSGDVDGILFYVMPYVEGESLRDRLTREKQLPVEDAVQITCQVSDALDYAHQNGVVHRDIKPENILLAAGHSRVADFGIARAIGAAGGDKLTETGLAVGTPETMSPEQAAGEEDIDGRSDIYALGCVLYEMMAGQPPFTGPTKQSVVRQHLAVEATPITNFRAGVPDAVSAALIRSLAKVPADRYRTAGEFSKALRAAWMGAHPHWRHPVAVAALFGVASLAVVALAWTLMIQLGLPDWVVPGAIALLVVGLPIVTTTAIVQRGHGGPMGGGIRRWLTWRIALSGGGLAFGGLAVVTAAYLAMRALGIGPVGTLLATGALEQDGRIVLADFDNRTDDPTLGPSITEALRVDLNQSGVVYLLDASEIAGTLRLMERSAQDPFYSTTAREVAEREGAGAVIAGEIRPLGGGYLLLASLVSPVSGEVLTSVRETAEDEGEIIGAVDRLSARLRDRIGEPLKAIRSSPSLGRVTTPSLAALRKFSEAQRVRFGDEPRALSLLEEAVALDTTFAMAYRLIGTLVGNLGLSPRRSIEARRKAFEYRDRLTERERLFTMGSYYARGTGELDKAQLAYEAFVEAFPEQIGGWHNLGNVFMDRRQPERAEECFQRSYELGGGAFALSSLVGVQVALGKFKEAQTNLDELDPSSVYYHDYRARLAYALGDYEGTIGDIQELGRRGPLERGRALVHISAVRTVEGKLGEAEEYRKEALDLLAREGAGRDLLIATAAGATIRLALGLDVDAATQEVDAVLQQFPFDSLDPLDRPFLRFTLFFALAGRVGQATDLLAEWERQVEPEFRPRAEPRQRFLQGAIALSEHRVAEAILGLREALEAEPALPLQVVLPLLGRAYEADGQAESAIAVYEEYLGSSLGRFPNRAISMMATSHFPDAAWRADTYVRLGDLYREQGNLERAANSYNRFLDLWKEADAELGPRVEAVKQRLLGLGS